MIIPQNSTLTTSASMATSKSLKYKAKVLEPSLYSQFGCQLNNAARQRDLKINEARLIGRLFARKFTSISRRNTMEELDQLECTGTTFLEEKVADFVRQGVPITMVLPAFPAKSPNSQTKVLGALPDRGEELALQRLETFCAEVELEIYPKGCQVVIFSDGRVFNDLLGIPVEDVKAYNSELREMVKDCNFTHIMFDSLESRMESLIPNQDPSSFSAEILVSRYLLDSIDIATEIQTNSELKSTYCSLKRFLPRDLVPRYGGLTKTGFDKNVSKVAKLMLLRNQAFSKYVGELYPTSVRLSIHMYNNAGPKFGIRLLPTSDSISRTPWHCVICEDMDGTIHTLELHEVDKKKYKPTYKRGRAWGFIECA